MARFTAMIDMAKTPEDVKKEIGGFYPTAPAQATTSAYPYGLCISIEDDELTKLGLDGDMPSVGEMIHLAAMAKVTSVSRNEREMTDGTKKECRRIELQITHLATENEDEENTAEAQLAQSAARRERFYGKNEEN